MALGNEEPSVAQTWLAPAVAGASERLRTIDKQKRLNRRFEIFFEAVDNSKQQFISVDQLAIVLIID